MSEFEAELRFWRRYLHRNPEFGFEERSTAAFVADRLREFGFTDIETGIGGTGVVATLRLGTASNGTELGTYSRDTRRLTYVDDTFTSLDFGL